MRALPDSAWVYFEGDRGSKSWSATDAAAAMASGDAKLLDIRPTYQVERARVPGSTGVQLFMEKSDDDTLLDVAGRALIKNANPLTALYDKRVCVRNKNFEADLAASSVGADKAANIIVCCQEGLRAKMCADVMKNSLGYMNVGYVRGGFAADLKGDFPSEGKFKLRSAHIGGIGGALIKQEVVAATGAIIVALYAFLEYYPEQASALLKRIYGA